MGEGVDPRAGVDAMHNRNISYPYKNRTPFHWPSNPRPRQYTVEPAYNDIGLYDTSTTQSDILWYQLIRYR
jgi:hypothetical protein